MLEAPIKRPKSAIVESVGMRGRCIAVWSRPKLNAITDTNLDRHCQGRICCANQRRLLFRRNVGRASILFWRLVSLDWVRWDTFRHHNPPMKNANYLEGGHYKDRPQFIA